MSFGLLRQIMASALAVTLIPASTAHGADPVAESQAANEHVKALYEAGDYSQAVSLASEALRSAQNNLGSNHPVTADALHNLANLNKALAHYSRGEGLYRQALEVLQNLYGDKSPRLATTLCDFGELCIERENFTNAEAVLNRALEINLASVGSNHVETARTVNLLGRLFVRRTDYSRAESLLHRALDLREQRLGPRHRDVATSLNDLGELHRVRAEYGTALLIFKRALAIDEKALGRVHPDTASSLNYVGVTLMELGNVADAESFLRQSLEIRAKVLPGDHPDIATSLHNLAGISMRIGDYSKAGNLYEQALKIKTKTLGRDHHATSSTLMGLANLFLSMRDYPKAAEFYEEVRKIRSWSLGGDNPETASALVGLAQTARLQKNYPRAESLLQEALEIDQRTFGLENSRTAADLHSLGMVYRNTGKFGKAEKLFTQALNIRERLFGEDSRNNLTILNDLGLCLLDMHEWDKAAGIAERTRRIRHDELAGILTFASERERLVYETRRQPYSLLASCTNSRQLVVAILQNKAIVLDSILEDRLVAQLSARSLDRANVEQLNEAKTHLAELSLTAPSRTASNSFAAYLRDQEKTLERVEQTERGLARNVTGLGKPRRALSTTTEQIQSTLPKHSVLIEFLRYPHYLGNDKWEPCFGAAIISSKGEPHWVCYGPASPIELNITLYQSALQRPAKRKDAPRICSELYSSIWARLEPFIPRDTSTLIISPDAGLNFVSFATLIAPDGQFLGEKYSLRYVATGRDLLPTARARPNHEMVIFANPDYNAGGVTMRKSENALQPLLFSIKEAEVLQREAKEWKWPTQVYMGNDATETQVRNLQSPGILHFSTHGFAADSLANPFSLSGFAPTKRSSAEARSIVPHDPMAGVGITLAGAQATLDAWSRGEIPPSGNDGILTASETACLHLENTWLVTLSACDTGIGAVAGGEGVLGLRRGFFEAGAQNLLLTLWPVYDIPTYEFMTEFYAAVHKSGNPPAALAEVQKNWLMTMRKNRKTDIAIYVAGPFVLNSRGIQK